jgi:hypothetical protein
MTEPGQRFQSSKHFDPSQAALRDLDKVRLLDVWDAAASEADYREDAAGAAASRRFPDRVIVGKTVGWVERSETHHLSTRG